MRRHTELFPGLDGFGFKREALAVRLFVFERQEEFRVLVDPKKPEKGRKLFPQSTYVRLNQDSEVHSIPISSYQLPLDYSVSFMWESCNSERARAHNNRVKTLERPG